MNKQILLKSRPVGMVGKEHFETVDALLPKRLNEGELLLKARFISVDPYMRGRMNDVKSYVAPFEVGKPIVGGVVAEVVESNHIDFLPGDMVLGNLTWTELQVVNGALVKKLQKDLAPLSCYLGILGMPGLTAYFGLLHIGEPKAGETVVVSGAAGAVGSVVGQIAKIKGCRVVGIAGSDDKNAYLKNDLHFDEVINYRTTKDMSAAIATACPDGVDIYYDNVGGDISDAVLQHINKYARIIICGQISMYNSTQASVGIRPQVALIKNSAFMKGFVVSDFAEYFPEGIKQLAVWLSSGQLKHQETVMKGFDALPDAFIGLFRGDNIGKLLVEI
ncbi:NADP-dependent oxidoreductase [uncultured Bacteroides sp.]|uniref:NADP-dependent oxidoreductase n=1 Tax=uncultured Bacteroides sp. TaxID=162156 RepID=UPI002AAA7574|nr:NADP-dependent oxidoreductase [uncultured Bacteroides sp.]